MVKSIYQSQDVLTAPLIVFSTPLGQRVTLRTAEPEWEVAYERPALPGHAFRLATQQGPAAALCYLADLLAGTFKETDPLFEWAYVPQLTIPSPHTTTLRLPAWGDNTDDLEQR